MPFSFETTALDGLLVVKPRVFADARGQFYETYKRSEFAANGIADIFVQNNTSRSTRDVLRGLHYQLPPYAQAKLVRCVEGAIYDVAVDVRRGSSSYGRWVAQELSAENCHMLYVPAGFAHGFLTLSDIAQVNYQVSAEYHPESERGIAWDDPDIDIDWPVKAPLLSDKDSRYPRFRDAETFS